MNQAPDSSAASAALLVARAVLFAAERHADKRRKGARGEPYFNHLAEVAQLVAEATAGSDPVLVAAAYLHDVIEDTPTTASELRDQFGAEIAGLVAEVTDDKRLSRPEQKKSQVAKGATRSARANLIKLADKISNLNSLANSPPENWSAAQRREYIDFSAAVVDALRGVNATLEAKFARAAERARATISSP